MPSHPREDGWTRTLALLAAAVYDAEARARINPAWVAPGAPRELLRALQASPEVAHASARIPCLLADSRATWLADLLEGLDVGTAALLVRKGRRIAETLQANPRAYDRPVEVAA